MIQALTLDAGGTLFHPSRPAGLVYSEVASRWGCRVDPATVQERFAAAWKTWSRTDPGRTTVATPEEERAWWKALVAEVFRGCGTFADFDGFFDELFVAFASPDAWSLYPEVKATLDRLHAAHVPLAIVSNWDPRLELLCDRLGLSGYFTVILASGRVGISKPDPRIFAEAVERLGVAAREAAHIGDSLRDDVHGALGAGLQAVWLRRSSEGMEGPPVPQAVGREPDPEDAAPRGVAVAALLDEAVKLVVS
ncbi:MAG: HAD-IA family hydrolase [Candidatus Coatesbacteria bacterium]